MSEAELIDLIYRAALSDDWQSVTDALRLMLGGLVSTHMYGHDADANKLTLAAEAGYDPDMLLSYDRYYHGLNTWVPGIAKAPVGEVLSSRDYCPDEELLRSEFYNDWIRPQEDIGSGGGVVLFNDSRRFIFLGGNFRFKDRERVEHVWLGLMQRLGRHLRNAFEFRRRLQGERLVNRGYLDLIDRMENGIFLLDARGRIGFRNRAAQALSQAGRTFNTDSAGVLRLADAAADECLRAGIAAISGRDRLPFREAFVIRRAKPLRPLFATLSPFIADHDGTGVFTDFITDRMPVAILAVQERPAAGKSAQAVLMAAYGLTAAEADLALALRNGQSLRHHAEHRAVSMHTVRNQLKSVFEKTGTHRQAELVAALIPIVG